VRGVSVTAHANGANCSAGSFTAYATQFVGNQQSGVFSSANCGLVLDGCMLSGNLNGGIITDGKFTVVNSFFVKNSGDGGLYQRTATSGTTLFVNNTVADNGSSLSPAGVNCVSGSALAVVNTILWNNTTTGLGVKETNCATSFVASDDSSVATPTVPLSPQTPPGFVGSSDYHLMPSSPCIDQGTSSMNAPDHDFDFAPRPDAKTMKVDIGADEVQQ
jgi:hypothetical protein